MIKVIKSMNIHFKIGVSKVQDFGNFELYEITDDKVGSSTDDSHGIHTAYFLI